VISVSATPIVDRPSRLVRALARPRHGRLPLFPTIVLAVFVLAGAFGPTLAPHDPIQVDLAHSLIRPAITGGGNWSYPLGTDSLGRDMLSRLLGGARVDLIIGATSVFFSALIGLTVALVSGYHGGWVDAALMRMTDAVLAFPALLLALVIVGVFGASERNVVITIVAISWAGYARVLRSEVIRLRSEEFVRMAIVMGGGSYWIMRRHLIPNLVDALVVLSTLQLGVSIIVEGSLSFVGLGVPPPAPSWGGMLADSRNYLATAWWLPILPGLALSLVVLASNLMGDWLRSRRDPSQRG